MKGAIIWQAPHPDYPFHFRPLRKVLGGLRQDLDAPVSLHILTGHSYNKDKNRKGVEHYRGSVNLKLMDIANALFELIFYGVLERYPKLKIVSVENEIGWMPWMFQQWDYYYNRFKKAESAAVPRKPSSYFNDRSSPASSTITSAARTSPCGARTTHVVQRFPASELDLAELDQNHPTRSRPSCRKRHSAKSSATTSPGSTTSTHRSCRACKSRRRKNDWPQSLSCADAKELSHA